jgi:SAM-dependent methyltransferase
VSTNAFQSYAEKVDAYVSGRPEYPAALLAELPAAEFAIDLGAGTGIFTEFLALKAKKVLAVEPVAKMAQRIPVDRVPHIEIAIAGAETIPAGDGTADLVTAATAFHWFQYEKTTAEIVRVLRPGGTLALTWNVRDSRVPWVAKFDAVMDNYAGDTPRQSTGRWRRIFNDPRFRHRTSKSYGYTQPMLASGIVDRALSTSFIAALPGSEQVAVRQQIECIIAEEKTLAGQSKVEFPYVTQLFLFLRV